MKHILEEHACDVCEGVMVVGWMWFVVLGVWFLCLCLCGGCTGRHTYENTHEMILVITLFAVCLQSDPDLDEKKAKLKATHAWTALKNTQNK